MSATIMCDLAIIGGGAGGLSLAAGASQLGLKVVLIESGRMGGDCLNYGCVPSKSLLAAAKTHYHMQQASHLGIHAENIRVDFQRVMQHVHDVIATIAVHDSVERFESLGVQVINARAQFVDANTVSAGSQSVKARRLVIATGSSPFVPPIPGLNTVSYLSNETLFDIKDQPKHLIVVGGGPIGCELAQAFAMLGTKVTLLEAFNILPKDDSDCAAVVRESIEASGVDIHEQIKILQVCQEDCDIRVEFEDEGEMHTVTGDALLVATGRRANVNGLALENANIKYSLKGIEIDARLRTSNKKIYAIGDVASPYQFTHVAGYHAGIALRNIVFKLPAKANHDAIPWVTYTYPELSHVGLTTQEASVRDDVQITEWSFEDNDRAQADREILGKIKVITDKKAKILGVSIVGNQAGELILPWVMAVREKKSLRAFTDAIAAYPTLSEVSKRAAGNFYAPKLFSQKTRRIVRWLQKLG